MSNLAVVVAIAFLAASFLIVQGVYTLKTGILLPFFVRQPASAAQPSLSRRLSGAALHLVPGVAILALLLEATLRRYLGVGLTDWFNMHMGPITVACIAGGSGLWLILCPHVMIRWVEEAYQQPISNDRTAQLILRVVATMFIVFAILVLLSVLHPK